MKTNINKKNLIISSIVLLLLILFNSINYTAYIINNKFNYLFFSISIVASIISCILFALKIEMSNKRSCIFTIVLMLISFLFSYMIVELLNQNILFSILPKRLLFNFILIIFLHLLIYSLFNKVSLAIILSNLIIFILGIVNYALICFRGTPFVPWDILSIKTAAFVADNYTFEFNHYILLAISLFIFIISLGFKATYKFKNKEINSILRFFFISLILILSIGFYITDMIDFFELETDLWKPKEEYSSNGFLASFAKQSKSLFIEKPANYSINSIKNVLAEYQTVSNNNEIPPKHSDSPNIIVIMNESYSDLTIHGDFETSTEYMSYFKSLTNNTIRGNTYVSIVGAQTPNSEWEFLTNNSMSFMPHRTIPYQQFIKTPSYSLATTLKSQGYTAKGLHSWHGSGYRRNAVYPLLGFDSFESIESLNDLEFIRNYPSDLCTYKHIIRQFEEKKEGEKLFNFTVTMQNHGSYDIPHYESTVFLKNIENCPHVEQYLTLMKESDKALEYLINYFENYDENTIILFFGDHQPSFSRLENEFWDTRTKSPNDQNRYITPFILWANYDIEEKYIDKISLNYLSILLLDVANLKTTPYMNFLKDVQKQLPVITGNGYIDNNGNYYTSNLSLANSNNIYIYIDKNGALHTYDINNNKYSELLKQYQLIQYNNVFDNKNKIDDLFKIRN